MHALSPRCPSCPCCAHRHTHAHVSAYLTIHIVSLSCLLNVFFLSLVIHIFLFLLLSFLLHLFLFYVLCFLLVVDVFVVALVFWACIWIISKFVARGQFRFGFSTGSLMPKVRAIDNTPHSTNACVSVCVFVCKDTLLSWCPVSSARLSTLLTA